MGTQETQCPKGWLCQLPREYQAGPPLSPDPCPPLCTILPPLSTATHTLPTSDPTFGFCSHSGSRTAGPRSHGNRCSPCTWLDLDLGSDGQASLTGVDGQLQRMRKRH